MHEATDGRPAARRKGPLVYRQSAWTRATHWLWATSVFFLLVSGLQIFNAHPALYLGEELGFEYDNAVLVLGAEQTEQGLRGTTTILGHTLDTTGLLGASGGVPTRLSGLGDPARQPGSRNRPRRPLLLGLGAGRRRSWSGASPRS